MSDARIPVSGFTIVRNGLKMDYPFVESILSLLPHVDEFVVAVGDSDDGTEAVLRDLERQHPGKFKLFASPWDPARTRNGEELARQTNLALDACTHDVCFYLQADEVLPDVDREVIAQDLARFAADDTLDTLMFRWIHFYGGYYSVIHSKRWYRREIRVIKRSRGLRSFGDAQSFRIWDAALSRFRKSRAALSRGHVLHYGWAKEETLMRAKYAELGRYWGRDTEAIKQDRAPIYQNQFGLQLFTSEHPAVMQSRAGARPAEEPAWRQLAPQRDRHYWRFWATSILEKLFDWRPGEFKSHRRLKKF